jgi:hypothetical protein
MKPRLIFDESTDMDVLALAELAPELRGVIEALLEHINDGTGKPVCGASDFEPDLLVTAALASDCLRCRNARMIDDGKPPRDVSTWEPQPWDGADTMLDEKQKRSDGR